MAAKDTNKKILITIGLFAVLAGFGFLAAYSQLNPTGQAIAQSGSRPKYCDENGCIPNEVFESIPSYPDGLDIIRTNTLIGRYSVFENFAAVAPLCKKWNSDFSQCLDFTSDRNYYLQPEFYSTTWFGAGYTFYTGLGNSSFVGSYVNVLGISSFPNAVVATPQSDSPIKSGTDLRVVTYISAGWGVRNYQGVHLDVFYPVQGKVAAGTLFEVKQDPDVVKNYFDVKISPQEFVLGRSLPTFETKDGGCRPIGSYQQPCEDWTRKVEVLVHINENTPPGKYLIGITPATVSKTNETRWTNTYGFRYYTFTGFAVEPALYSIFVEVQ